MSIKKVKNDDQDICFINNLHLGVNDGEWAWRASWENFRTFARNEKGLDGIKGSSGRRGVTALAINDRKGDGDEARELGCGGEAVS